MASEAAELSAIIRDIYDAAIDPARQRALESVCTFVGSSSARGVAIPLTEQERWFAHVLPLKSGRRQQAASNYGGGRCVYPQDRF
jgi:hypothetical protein